MVDNCLNKKAEETEDEMKPWDLFAGAEHIYVMLLIKYSLNNVISNGGDGAFEILFNAHV